MSGRNPPVPLGRTGGPLFHPTVRAPAMPRTGSGAPRRQLVPPSGVAAGLRGAAAAWVVALASFFLASYGGAAWLASRQAEVASHAFAWERGIPLVPWTVVPYWSLVPLYLASPFLCRDRAELDGLGRRLLAVQAAAVACFVLFPRRFGWVRPEMDGMPGALLALLSQVDTPFNQAPSLHVALSVVLGAFYARLARQRRPGVAPGPTLGAAWAVHAWFGLVGLSVLTTHQHHALDVPAGVLLGILCLRLRPGSAAGPRHTAQRRRDGMRAGWIAALAAGSLLLASAGMAQGPRPGDACSAWVICPGGLTSGTYPDCQCLDTARRSVETCATSFVCRPPRVVSGDWPDCACSVPPPPPCKECGEGYIKGPHCSCIPIIVNQ